MKSPLVLTSALIATGCALVGYFVGGALENADAISLTIGLFIGALVSPLIVKLLSGEQQTAAAIKTLYVGNLPYRANEAAVRSLFSSYGEVHSVRLMKDKQTGKRRGFGFVEISAADADGAIESLNDTEFQQRTLKVREAKERPEPGQGND
ncbi:RNA recognition motif domain-containing protein [Thalassotalea sp. PS06]|uniref:RNA recognition motif domain-containing protein n=1 Tax=Thalassotalea sp. PS06 TaxID=2594005 RepID=UPI0011651D13|nr:RNA-binding protein [Thalassotalea sp. PS06]QDP00105.1 RNA-binding protein [Thalassotalea sp. PS06]